jgi:signal transduction histidine kinase
VSAAYPETVNPMLRRARLRAAARAAADRAWHGLIQVLIGAEPVPVSDGARRGHWHLQRRRAYAALALATLALCAINVASVHGVAGAHGRLPAGPFRLPVGQLPPSLMQQVLAVAAVVPLALAARYPMLAWRIGWLALLLVPLQPAAWWGGWPWGPPQIVALLAAFCVAGVRQQRPALWWMYALSLIPWWLWLAAHVPDLHGPVSATIVFTAATIALDSFSSRLRTQRALTRQTERTEVERASRAVLEERTRIARELHDVVAHHMSLIAVRAETAPYRLSGLSEPALAEFASLSQVAREALADMRRLLGVLRHDQPAALAPQPLLADLPTLVNAARQAGVSVELSIPAALDQVPSGIGMCAYRIVQESLTNASQHAPGAPVTVSVDQDSGAVQLRVANGPAGSAGATDDDRRPGHGLTGMRERVALLGGSLSAGPAADGGFIVSAVIPLGATVDGRTGTS